jgi:CRISPR/Cas system-associated exonuclease Cas4 (RecB family)
MVNNFSPNMLKTYQSCPKKFYYRYVEGVNVPMSATPFEKGKKIHALANYFLQGVNISRIETALTDSEREVWKTLLANPFFQKDYFKSEYQLSCKIGEFWVGGRLDAVVTTGDEFYILDYKTGSIPKNPEYDYQTMVYLLALDRFLKGKYASLSFVYINLKDKQNHVIQFTPQLKSEYEKRIIDICTQINNDTIYQINANSCSRCEYAKICSK